MQFQDFNLKLAVVGALMEQGDFVDEANEVQQNAPEGPVRLRAMQQHFRDLELDEEQLEAVEELFVDGANAIYDYVAGDDWRGDDDRFDVQSIEDLTLLKNLRLFKPLGMMARSQIDLTPLLRCEALEELWIDKQWVAQTSSNAEVVATLEARGVTVRRT